jgi:hypothetical protein
MRGDPTGHVAEPPIRPGRAERPLAVLAAALGAAVIAVQDTPVGDEGLAKS